ncbi:MAG: hypothetical protein OEM02_15510 [Desulfobulbaceae bacterium]|nr:hypothetical protein [Desulfobulbaceae bacterium]
MKYGKSGSGNMARRKKILTVLFVILLAVLCFVLGWAYLSPTPPRPGLGPEVADRLTQSGVESPVTAVLLNFRGYDTLLECFVVLLAVIGVWSLVVPRTITLPRESDAIFSSLVSLLAPLMLVVAGYLVWSGGDGVGGAFQAGAVLGGTGVLLHLADRPLTRSVSLSFLTMGVLLGPALFLALAVLCVLLGYNLLQYPPGSGGVFIALIEVTAALSIGLSLAALFGGRYPGIPKHSDRKDSMINFVYRKKSP